MYEERRGGRDVPRDTDPAEEEGTCPEEYADEEREPYIVA